MSVTANPTDKYAFLFTGPTAIANYIVDIESVYATLTQYYQYPPTNIMVVLGSTDATPTVPGTTPTTITNATELDTALTSFKSMASGANKTALLYFTGGGQLDLSGSVLRIDGLLTGGATIDPAWLTTRLNAISGGCQVHVVMQQSFSGGFDVALTGSTLSQWSFSHACGAGPSPGGITGESYSDAAGGGYFTQGWIRGLRLEALPGMTPDFHKHADELGAAGESSNRYISLEEAMDFGKQVHDYDYGYSGLAIPGYQGTGGPQYLGLPEFLIRDGSPYYESPDVYLSHPNHSYLPTGDLYIPDPEPPVAPYYNTINVDVRNIGTHPVRAYSLGIERFGSGLGSVEKQLTACDITPPGGVLLPMDASDIGTADDKKHTYEWNTPFPLPSTHTCVKAEAKLLCGDVDFAWDPAVYDYEAQRNIDEMTIVPPPPPPLPYPNLQGFKEHVYGIRNTFDDPRRFYMLFPPKFPGYADIIDLQWFELPQGPGSERIPLELVEEPVLHIPFDLKAGESRDLLVRVDMKPAFPADNKLKLPFDIFVAGEWHEQPMIREATTAVPLQNVASIAGFTLVLRRGESTVKGVVLDRENNPVADARVVLRTVNDLQGAVVKTDAAGNYKLAGINPDVFQLRAEAAGWRSKEQTVVLQAGKTEELTLDLTEEAPQIGKPVKVILDKIRILNDRDPMIFGKGELTFTAIVVPDHDDSRKQVNRLPAIGVYHVSDKPGKNDIQLGVTLFDGVVQDRALSITISGKEIDFFTPNDEMNRYHRVFTGDPDDWYCQYYPNDEYLDREDVGDWALWYRIVQD